MSSDQDKYYRRYPLTNPAYAVARIAGGHIRARASKYFSGKMIEIGCGTKAKGLLVGEFVEEHIGLDHEASPHDQSDVDIFGTAYNIPVDNESFDCALSTAVLEHLEEPKKALRETYRVLKPGGYVLYTAPLFWHLHEEPRDFFRYTQHGIRYLFEKAGFHIVEIQPMSGFWLTFSTELSYYLSSLARGPLKYVMKPLIVLNNLVIPLLDKVDRRFNPGTTKWTWMYMVVACKP